jgi:hypothetical protein
MRASASILASASALARASANALASTSAEVLLAHLLRGKPRFHILPCTLGCFLHSFGFHHGALLGLGLGANIHFKPGTDLRFTFDARAGLRLGLFACQRFRLGFLARRCQRRRVVAYSRDRNCCRPCGPACRR